MMSEEFQSCQLSFLGGHPWKNKETILQMQPQGCYGKGTDYTLVCIYGIIFDL